MLVFTTPYFADSTTGIGRGSVLYCTLLNMVALYDNPQAKREGINLLGSIRWQKTVTATHLHVDGIFLQYQALAAATANNPVATKAPTLTWELEYDLIHNVLPEWAKRLIVTSPDLFDSKPNLWAEIHHHEPAEHSSF